MVPPASAALPHRPSWRELLVVLLITSAYWFATWTASKDLPAMADEIAHVTGGVSYWRYGVNHLQPENAFVSMHWATAPLLLDLPSLPAMPNDLPQGSSMIVIGYRFFYESGASPASMLAIGRGMIAVFGAGLVALIWWWARRLWGRPGGWFAAGLAAFCPTLLTHGGMIMSDITLSLFLLTALTAYWALLQRVSALRILVCGLSLGLLFLSKMSGVLALPMFAALALIRLWQGDALSWHLLRPYAPVRGIRLAAVIAGATAAVGLVSIAVLWAAFGFQYSMFANAAAPRPRFDDTWAVLLADGGIVSAVINTMREYRLLPEAWLYGFAHTRHFLPDRWAFLNGEMGVRSWWYYFPYACLVKTPLPLFGLMALGGMAAVDLRQPGTTPRAAIKLRHFGYAAAPLLVLFCIYWAFAITAGINIGHRHILPVYAPMLILAGGATYWLVQGSRSTRWITLALGLWFVGESLWIRPHYIAYFNALAGGPANGYRHLLDSNVDAGQDLLRLRDWLDTQRGANGEIARPVFLSIYGPADPVAHGIRAVRFADDAFDARPKIFPAIVHGGFFCISATLSQGLYTLAPGAWTASREKLYQDLINIATTRAPTVQEAWMLEHLQFARLRHWLIAREPDARVGYSIFIFSLTDGEVAQALYAPLPEIARVVAARRREPN